jgi:glycosyltransferase involved in cell wall biosynthesis
VIGWLRPGLGQLATHAPRPLRLPALPQVAARSSAAPSISVVVPSLNQGRFIGETLDSLLAEDYPALELIVIDGGSTDETLEVVRQREQRIAYLCSERDAGQANAINKGFARSTGEIMAWINSDDRIVPGALSLVARHFADHPEVDVVYGDRILIDERGLEVGRWVLPGHSARVLRWIDFVPQETLYWRREAWERVGSCLDESFRFAMDWDLLLRFHESGANMRHISRFLGIFRVHELQKTSRDMATIGQREMNILRTRSADRPPSRWTMRWNVAPYLLAARIVELRSRLMGDDAQEQRRDRSMPREEAVAENSTNHQRERGKT